MCQNKFSERKFQTNFFLLNNKEFKKPFKKNL